MNTLEGAKELVEREAVRTTKMNQVVVTSDGTNEAVIPGFPYRFKAQGDKILVAVDIFKSGFECKACAGTGKISWHCKCEDTDRPGFRYTLLQLEEVSASLGADMSQARKTIPCADCHGDFLGARRNSTCDICKGKGASIYIPDISKNLPTTGVIVSVGAEVRNPELSNNTRVLFGAYTGTMIPTKAVGVAFKVLRDIEVLCVIKGGEDLAAFDFVVTDKDL